MRSGLYVLTFLLVLCGIGGAISWNRSRTAPGITIENFRRLRVGMTLDQVTEIFGRTYHRRDADFGGGSGYYWYSPAVTFDIYVDEATGRVTGGHPLRSHEEEIVRDDSWEAWWNECWFGVQKVRE